MAQQSKELKNMGYEIFIGALSGLALVNLVLTIFINDQTLQNVLFIINGLMSIIFLIDFTYRISTAPSKGGYFLRSFGWADLLSCLPFPLAKILRVFRMYRVNRSLQAIGVNRIGRALLKDRAGSALLTLLLLGILVLEFGSLLMLNVEGNSAHANIKTASDAMWYTIVTISTVGYGDQYPVTNAGRLVGGVIIVIGVGIFGTFTGYLAKQFLSSEEEEAEKNAVPGNAEDPSAMLEQLKLLMAQQMREQQAAIEEIERRLVRKEA